MKKTATNKTNKRATKAERNAVSELRSTGWLDEQEAARRKLCDLRASLAPVLSDNAWEIMHNADSALTRLIEAWRSRSSSDQDQGSAPAQPSEESRP